jgi:hypothetical protein
VQRAALRVVDQQRHADEHREWQSMQEIAGTQLEHLLGHRAYIEVQQGPEQKYVGQEQWIDADIERALVHQWRQQQQMYRKHEHEQSQDIVGDPVAALHQPQCRGEQRAKHCTAQRDRTDQIHRGARYLNYAATLPRSKY